MTSYRISSVNDSVKALEYFNAFHDGLIKRIEITSQDEVTPDKSQIVTGLFDVTLIIAHYNYDEGRQPYNRLIEFAFTNARNIHMDFRAEGELDWNINAMAIQEVDDLLLFVLERNQYDGKKWTVQEHRLFLFESAEISEQ
jgi:hypothetical protein